MQKNARHLKIKSRLHKN